MSLKKQNADNYLLYDTPVENIFISEYAKNAPGDYVKVYLLALMYAQQGLDASDSKLASEFSMSLKEVEDAWEHWRECGIVERRQRENAPNEKDTEFVNIKEKYFSKGPLQNKRSSNTGRLNDKEIADLFKDIEKTAGRLLEAKEPEAVAVWLRDFGIKPEVILLGYEYCVKNEIMITYTLHSRDT